MKRFKHIFPFLLALIMAFAIPLAACDACSKGKGNQDGDGDEGEVKVLQSISIDYDDVQTVFAKGEQFNSDGLVVTAYYLVGEDEEEDEATLKAGEYEVDTSEFNNRELGKYTITVRYTYDYVTEEEEYEVEVVRAQDGLDVKLVEGVSDTYELSATVTKATIDTTKIVVKEVNRDGTLSEPITDYTTKLYRGDEEIEIGADGKADVEAGAYAIWAEKESEVFPGFIRANFVAIYVNDVMTGFKLKEGVGEFEQRRGFDTISKTWVFEATYASGNKADIPASKCKISIDTMTAGDNKSAVVNYTEYNASGVQLETWTVNVPYTILPAYGLSTITYDYNAIDNSDMGGDNTPLKQSDLIGVNAFLTLGSGTILYRNKTKWNAGADVVEFKNEGFKVTFAGTGTLTLGVSSTNGTNQSQVGLKNSSGKYVQAASVPAGATEKSGSYVITGTGATVLTFTISTPGTYAIVTDSAISRNARLLSLVVEDYVPEPAAASLSLKNQTIAYKKVEVE